MAAKCALTGSQVDGVVVRFMGGKRTGSPEMPARHGWA
jgi:hypothetical protein